MTITESYYQLAQEPVDSSADLIYTAAANTQTIIKHIVVVNPTGSGSACWVKLWTSGTTDDNNILPEVSLAVGEWGEFDGTITLTAGDSLHAQGEVANIITITVHGVELVTS